MSAAVFKQHGCQPFCAALRHDEVGAFAIVAMDFAMNLVAASGKSA
jgi:hypothetical protein